MLAKNLSSWLIRHLTQVEKRNHDPLPFPPRGLKLGTLSLLNV